MFYPQRIYEQIGQWMQRTYVPTQKQEMTITFGSAACSNLETLSYVPQEFSVGDGFVYTGYSQTACDMITPITLFQDKKAGRFIGALLFHFTHKETSETFDALLVSTWNEHHNELVMVCFPGKYAANWITFEDECDRIQSTGMAYQREVFVIGGVHRSLKTNITLDDIHLPPELKTSIINDVDSFFEKGAAIYQELNLKPFRKILLAGVPGTGKTMLCSALANRALKKGLFVIYVSGSNIAGSEFWKIHRALEVASNSDKATIVLVEELDTYMHEDTRAQMLNVLDGSETPMNPHGTLLIATTNYPEKIDNRVMKRPGRLDRIFIIPEMTNEEDAEKMLRQYLGKAWREEYRGIVPELLNRPGAFIREVALYALTIAAYQHSNELTLEILEESLDSLIGQIEAKENFLTSHRDREMGLLAQGNGKRRRSKNGFNNGSNH